METIPTAPFCDETLRLLHCEYVGDLGVALDGLDEKGVRDAAFELALFVVSLRERLEKHGLTFETHGVAQG